MKYMLYYLNNKTYINKMSSIIFNYFVYNIVYEYIIDIYLNYKCGIGLQLANGK